MKGWKGKRRERKRGEQKQFEFHISAEFWGFFFLLICQVLIWTNTEYIADIKEGWHCFYLTIPQCFKLVPQNNLVHYLVK